MKSFLTHTNGGSSTGPKSKRPRFEFLGIAEHTSSSSSDGDILGADGTYSSTMDYSKSSLRLHALINRLDSSINTMMCEGEVMSDMFVNIGSHFRRYNQQISNTLSTLKEITQVCAERGVDATAHKRYGDAPHGYMVEPMCHEPRSVATASTNMPSSLPLGSHQAPPPPPPPMVSHAMVPLMNRATPHGTPSSPPRFHSALPSTANMGKPAITLSAKRPLSDFNFFCRDARKLVVEAHPEYTKEQVNKELGRIWSVLDKNSRQHYRSMYIQDKLRYKQDVATLSGSAKRDASGNKKIKNAGNANAADCNAPDRVCDQVRLTIRRCVSIHSDDTPASSALNLSMYKHPPCTSTPQPEAVPPAAKVHSHLRQFSVSEIARMLPAALSNRLSPRTPEDTDETDDIDEPLAHTLLRSNSQVK